MPTAPLPRALAPARAAALATALAGALAGAPLTAQDSAAADSARRLENARRDTAAATRLYGETTPLAVTLVANLGRLRRDTEDGAPWRDGTLAFDDEGGRRVELPVRVRTRGIWRLGNCHFPPLRLDLPLGAARATRLAGVNRPKLVTHCRDDGRGDDYVLRELQLYRIYQLLTPLSHRARLLRVTYVDSASGRPATTRWAILLEEPEALAARLGGQLVEAKGARPADLDTATRTLAAVFQYFIGNTDWSIAALHNAELLATGGELLHPIPYDFDFSGAVGTHYSTPPPQLRIRSVRERLFRGYCAPEAEFERVFALFRERRPAIEALYADEIGRLLDPGTVSRTLEYFADFHRTIDDPGAARRRIIGECRDPNGA